MNNLAMRPATAANLPAIYEIYRTAIDAMNKNGIPQWDEIYPSPAILEADLRRGELYVADSQGIVLASVVMNEQCDPAYDDATWEYGGPYVIVHRLCVSPAAQGRGVGRWLMSAVEAWACARGYRAIRLDAFSLNPHALRMYTGLGYERRGEANWRKGLFYLLEKRIAP